MAEKNSKLTSVLSKTVNIQQIKRLVQNYLLIWLDPNIDESNDDCQNTLEQLRNTIDGINIFTDVDQCVDFLTDINHAKAFIVISGILGENLVPSIHEISTLGAIFIFCDNKTIHEGWVKQWPKIKGVYTQITSICEALQQAAKQCDQDSIPISFFSASDGIINQNLDQLEPLFIYTQILKEVLLEMTYDQLSINEFTTYCRNGSYVALNNINRFENDYCSPFAIWWYTQPSFIYSMLNRALRLMEADTIIKMGFFIRDLHCQIQELHYLQLMDYHGGSLTVYRGQGLSTIDFEKMMNTRGGLISFNCFLSTSEDREVAAGFAEIALTNPDSVGIIFKMTIDPSVSSVPFAATGEISFFKTEKEVLFSMHTIFRIGEIDLIDNNDRLYQVELKLTADEDQQLRTLSEQIRKETRGSTGWERLGKLLVSIGQYEKVEDFFMLLLEQAYDTEQKGLFYNQLGHIKDRQGDYEKAIFYLDRSLEIRQKTHPHSHPTLATSYNNSGEVYRKMGEYSKALSLYKKAIEIEENTVPSNDLSLASTYSNIGLVYRQMAEYSKALSFMKKAFEIRQKSLPSNHPDLANSYDNIAMVYDNTGEYSKALSFYEKSLEIRQKSLPPNHPSLIVSYNNIAKMSEHVRDHSKALSFYEKAIQICQETLSPNHPSLSICYSNIGSVYESMKDYSKALSFYEKALAIWEKTLLLNHPDLASLYNNIAGLYSHKQEYSKALMFHEKSLEIYHKTLPPNHPLLATSYNNIGRVYQDMGHSGKALTFYEKVLHIRQKILPLHHLDFAQSYNNIAGVYYNTGNYSKALSFLERALDISQRVLPPNHPHLQYVRNGIEMVKKKL